MLGDNIKLLMKKNNISSKDLAEKVGVSPTHISYILNNKRHPSIELVQKIAHALGRTENELLDFESDDEVISEFLKDPSKKNQIKTIAAHLDDKNVTPEKLKLLTEYIDVLFKEM